MFILQLYSGQDTGAGDFVYRIAQPATGLASLPGVEVLNLDLLQVANWSLLEQTPLLILHHLSDPDMLQVVRQRRRQRLPTIYELADNFRVSHQHLAEASSKGPPDYHCVMEMLLQECDAVQTTSAALAEKYRSLNGNWLIFPNLVAKKTIKKRKAKSDRSITIGWGGSARHLADLQRFAPAVIRWLQRHCNVRMAIMASHKIATLFSELPRQQVAIHPPGSLAAYHGFLDSLDIGLAPLLPTEFNACRSDVKFLEYAARGVVPVCSNFGPYRQLSQSFQHMLLFRNEEELIARLNQLIADDDFRNRHAELAQHYVRTERCLENHDWRARLRCYERLQKQGQGSVSSRNAPPAAILNTDDTATLNQLLQSPVNDATIQTMKALLARQPRNFQMHYFLATFLLQRNETKAAIPHLQQALHLKPNSLRTLQLLARCHLLLGDVDAAEDVLRRALAFKPVLPTLTALHGMLLYLSGQNDAACEVLDDCLAASGQIVEARLLRARLALKRGELEKVETLAQELSRLAPESPDWSLLLAQVAYARRDRATAQRHLDQALAFQPQHKAARQLYRKIKNAR